MEKILIIAYVFPPIAYAGTHRTLRLCRHLAEFGYSVHVVSINVQMDLHNDFELLAKIEPYVTINRTLTVDPWRFFNRVNPALQRSFMGRIIAKVMGAAVNFVCKPDHMLFWVPFAVPACLRTVHRDGCRIIYTTSPPHSEHLLGAILRKVTKIQWVADLRDPIMDNITATDFRGLNKWINIRLERLIASRADAVIFNTRKAMDLFEKRYDTGKAFLIRNSYSEDDFKQSDGKKFEKFTISHVGSIYDFRNPELVLKAISSLNLNRKISPDNLRLKFIGMRDGSLIKKIKQLNIEQFVDLKSMVSHSEAIQVMKQSHLLLLIKGFGANSTVQVPGKMYEYIGAGVPIICIGPKDSEAAEILAQIGAGHTIEADVNEMSNLILRYYNRYRKGVVPQTLYSEARKSFSSRSMANKFEHLFKKLGVSPTISKNSNSK